MEDGVCAVPPLDPEKAAGSANLHAAFELEPAIVSGVLTQKAEIPSARSQEGDPSKSRKYFLDGIRGWASVAVLLSHAVGR